LAFGAYLEARMEEKELLDTAWELGFSDPPAARELLIALCEADNAEALFVAACTYDAFCAGAEREAMLTYFRHAFDLGHGRAALHLGFAYSGGETQEKAERYFRDARARLQREADAGDALAQHSLALCYLCGLGGEPDEAQRVSWLQRAASGGCIPSVVELYYYYRTLGSEHAGDYYRELKRCGCPVPRDEQYEGTD
jgi:uncharacterized protein